MDRFKFRVWDMLDESFEYWEIPGPEQFPAHPGSCDWIAEQCTGVAVIRDNKITLIYEGDKINFTTFDHNGADTQHTGYVVWSEDMWMVWHSPESEYFGSDGGFILGHLESDGIEVVGNIHENPELLEG